MSDATADLLAALKLAADPEAHAKLMAAIAEHKKAKEEADASIADMRNRAYQLDRRRDEMDGAEKALRIKESAHESAKSRFDAEVSEFRQRKSDFSREKEEFDSRMRDLLSRENSLKARSAQIQNMNDDLKRAQDTLADKVSKTKEIWA